MVAPHAVLADLCAAAGALQEAAARRARGRSAAGMLRAFALALGQMADPRVLRIVDQEVFPAGEAEAEGGAFAGRDDGGALQLAPMPATASSADINLAR